MRESKLKNGLIPARTICPYKPECKYSMCIYKGVEHTVDFSCAVARGIEIMHRYEARKRRGIVSN